MSEIRITFNAAWGAKKRMEEINHRLGNTLKGARIIKLLLEKQIGRVGSVVEVETAVWTGFKEQEHMLKTATSFLINYEHN